MSDAQDQPAGLIIDAFGGIRPMASKLGIPVSTVQGWKQRDSIPAARMAAVQAAAAAAGISLSGETGQDAPIVPAASPESPDRGAATSKPSDSEASGSRASAATREIPEETVEAPQEHAHAAPARGGGMAMFALVVALAVGGWVWWATAGPGASGGDNARLSALEGRVARLADAPHAGGAGQAELDSLAKDVAALQARLAEIKSPDLAEALAPLRSEIDELRTAMGAAGTGGGATDPAILARLDALDTEIQNAIQVASTNMQAMSGALLEFDARLKTLAEAQAKSQGDMAARVAALEAGRSAEQVAVSRASALALAAGQLRTALERGAAFAEPLAILESLKDDDPKLAAALETLRGMADTGAATAPALELSFAGLVPDLLAASRDGETDDLVDRLTDRINDIVRVRRTGADVPGDSVEARIARAEILLGDGDIAAATSELDGISGAAAERLAPWMMQAQGHLDARDALAEIETQAIARLRAEGGS